MSPLTLSRFSLLKSPWSHFYSWREKRVVIFSLKSAVCVSQLLNTWVTSSSDRAHQAKKCLRLAPPPLLKLWFVEEPPPHTHTRWIVNLNLVPNPHLSRKSSPSTVSCFSSASSLIFICFFVFAPGGRSLTPEACLVISSNARGCCLAQENFRCMFLLGQKRGFSFFFFCQYFQILPAGPQLKTSSFLASGCFSESAHFLLFVSVCVCLLSCLTLLRQSGKLSCCH